MIDMFKFKNNQEIEKMIADFWEEIEYLVKVRILLSAFEGYSITKLEERGISKMWLALSLEKRKDIFNYQYRYKFTQ